MARDRHPSETPIFGDLKPADELEPITATRLARGSNAVLRALADSDQAVSVTVQGQPALVAMSQRRYDALVQAVTASKPHATDTSFTEQLTQRFDALVAEMKAPGAAQAASDVLFGDLATMNAAHRPGTTERSDEASD
ncbi:MAG: hypothetical protein AAGH19_02730 [Pseudomonadota bacterium]